MKELSIEEKARRYDEAIERGKQIQNTPYTAHWDIMKEVAERLLPELAEPEDEKIRKSIIRCLKGTMPDNVFREKYIAWLERQGAKVSAIEGFETEFERQVSDLIASTINKEHEYNQGYVKWTANALLNYAKRELEKRGKQEPWSEEDKQYLEDTLTLLEGNRSVHTYGEVKNWLKSLKERVLPQNTWKPSDEQMKGIECTIKTLKYQLNVGDKRLNSLYDDLKKLREE